MPDGPAPTRFDSGQEASLAPVADPSWTMFVRGGRLTYAPVTEGLSAGYLRTPDMGRAITRMGMEWVMEPGLEGSGVVVLGVTNELVDPTDSAGTPISMHLLVRRDLWVYSVSPGPFNNDPRLIEVASGIIDPPLVEDSFTVYRMEAAIDGENVTLSLPDGNVAYFRDPRIASWAGRYGFFEVYSESSLTDGKTGLVRVWADA